MLNILANNIRIKHDSWNYRKYEDYNNCPYCNGRIRMECSFGDFQKFRCLECGKEFIVNTITVEID